MFALWQRQRVFHLTKLVFAYLTVPVIAQSLRNFVVLMLVFILSWTVTCKG